jgi:hypothetical protein
MTKTEGQLRALDMLKQLEPGTTMEQIGAGYNCGRDAVYFCIRFGRFISWQDKQPGAGKREIPSGWARFDKL